jgi:hypothetical protein
MSVDPDLNDLFAPTAGHSTLGLIPPTRNGKRPRTFLEHNSGRSLWAVGFRFGFWECQSRVSFFSLSSGIEEATMDTVVVEVPAARDQAALSSVSGTSSALSWRRIRDRMHRSAAARIRGGRRFRPGRTPGSPQPLLGHHGDLAGRCPMGLIRYRRVCGRSTRASWTGTRSVPRKKELTARFATMGVLAPEIRRR